MPPSHQRSEKPPIIVLHPDDDVGVARRPLRPNELLSRPDGELAVLEMIPPSHKISLKNINPGQPVRKYGQVIGFACGPIEAGRHVHTHNLEVRPFDRVTLPQACEPLNSYPHACERTFMGYDRGEGRSGTRNYIAIISNVNCSASVAKYVRDRFPAEVLKKDFPGVDGVLAFTHKSGCVIGPGEPTRLLNRVLAGVASHPNIAGYVMIGLGCEGNQLDFLKRDFLAGSAADFLTIQTVGGLRKTVDAGTAAVLALLPKANAVHRTPLPIARLKLAENCGGSDANSGITANPALGWASDELIRYGGTSVLAETPEIYGAEHLLAARAVSPEVAARLMDLIRWWERHVAAHDCSIDNNPSFGNKQGGLSTIYEKSLGAVAKGGQAPLTEVYGYAEPVKARGLCFMDTPGFDPVSMTGLMAGGCNVGVFTTGRGSVYGCKPMPCIKVATNTALYDWMEEDMDFNAGGILDGTETVAAAGRRLLEKIIAVASGERTKSELAGIGDEEFAPWIQGPTL